MKKGLKIALIVIGIVILSIFIIAGIVMKILSGRPVAPTDYQKMTQTGGVIEAKYMGNGPYDVKEREDGVLQEFSKFLTFYPSELESGSRKWPVIVLCNGSGTPLSKYTAVARHYASWGFIVIGTEEKYSWNALGADLAIEFLERWNDNEMIDDTVSVFYQKVDFSNVGVVGHSQGGVGVINAITDTRNSDVFTAAVSLSPTNKELAHNLLWDYDATKIDIPILLISGEGGGDDWVVTGEQLQDIYNDISSDKFMARRVDTVHNEVLYMPDGYITAWFMWQLQGDEEAAQAFIGDNPEIMTNPLYQDQVTNMR